MQMNQILYFLALYDERSITRTAKRYGVPQPTLTNAIRRLERILGGSLFDHTSRNTEPAELGRTIKPYLRADQQARRRGETQSGTFFATPRAPGPMRIFAAAVSLVLISANVVCASERLREPSVAAEGAVSVAQMQPPVQDDRPIADIISGKFYIYSTSETLNCKAGLFRMTQLAKAGNAEAMFELGELYETGDCVPANEPKALAWFLKAAETGNPAAPSVLGRLYYLGGEGIAPDYKKALRWLLKGVILLDAQASYDLGLMYQEGIGVRPNYKEAYKLFDLSMHLSPFFGDDRKMALVARDSARERLTPKEVADEALASKRLLIALLEHQSADNLLPKEALTALRGNNR